MTTTRNPRSGTSQSCSDVTVEPLPGTARSGGLILALEHTRGWGKDILDGEALGKELTGQIKRYLKTYRAQLQFIRRPGRAGQQEQDSVALYIANAGAEPPTLEYLELTGPEDLLQVDLSTPGSVPGAVRVGHPLLLVCTHGKRDMCCAVKGRPLAGGLHREYPEITWESSHTKGHRFAPSMILLPWNYSFGTLDLAGASAMLDDVLAGRLPVTGNRGRGTLDSRAQVAELAVAAVLADAGDPAAPGELKVSPYIDYLVYGEHKEDPQDPPVASAEPGPTHDPAADYAAVAAMVPEELRRRAGELMTQRIEMKITGRYEELKALKRQGYFQPVHDYEQAVKEAAVAHGVYGKYSRYGKYSAYAKTGAVGGTGERRPAKSRKDTPLLVTRAARPTGDDARSWRVTLESQRCYLVMSSCGDKPKEGRSWVATEVVELTA